MNEFLFDRLAPASVHGLVALVIAFLVTRIFHRLPADCQAWLWRLAIGRFLLALVWEMPLAVIPVAPAPPVAASAVTTSVILTETSVAPSVAIHPLTWIWAIGTLVVLTVGLSRWFKLWLLARRATSVEQGIRLSEETALPFLIGQTIVLPADMPTDARDVALAHELAHRNRRDPAYSLPNFAVSALFWFVLPVWLALREYAIQVEIDCDRRALRLSGVSPRNYGWLLVAMATGSSSPVGVAAMAGSPSTLRRRLTAMKHNPKPRNLTTLALTLALGALVLAPVRPVEALAPRPQSLEVAQSQAKVAKAQKELSKAIEQLNRAVKKNYAAKSNAWKTVKDGKGQIYIVTSDSRPAKGVRVTSRLAGKQLEEFRVTDVARFDEAHRAKIHAEMAKGQAQMIKGRAEMERAHIELEIARRQMTDSKSDVMLELHRAQELHALAQEQSVKQRIEQLERELQHLRQGGKTLSETTTISGVPFNNEIAMAKSDRLNLSYPATIEVKNLALNAQGAETIEMEAATGKIIRRIRSLNTNPATGISGQEIRVESVHADPAARAGGQVFEIATVGKDQVTTTQTISGMTSARAMPSITVTSAKDGVMILKVNGKSQTIKAGSGTKTVRIDGKVFKITTKKGKDGQVTIEVTTSK